MSDFKKLAPQYVGRAINDILHSGFDDVVSRPLFFPHFELDIARKSQHIQSLLKQEGLKAFNKTKISDMDFSAIDTFYRPKARFLQRKCAYIEPTDVVKYLALAVSIAATIEENRIDRGMKIVHSYRFNKTGKHIFSKNYGFHSFKEQSRKLSNNKKFQRKIITDIASFYDRVNIHRLESQLLSIGCEKEAVSKINDLLLTWNNRDSYGLPVGGNASRILAEAALIDIDRFLISQKITFLRFVDDFRIFAADVDEAAYILQIFQARLSEDGLTLNSEKTHIVPTEQADESVAKNLTNATPIIPTDIDTELDEDKNSKTDKNTIAIYKGRVPLSYRPPSEKKLEKLKNLDIHAAISRLESDFLSDIALVQDIIRAIVIQAQSDAGTKLPEILRRHIEIVPYAVDMMIEKSEIEESIIKQVGEKFEIWLLDGNRKPDYVITSIIRLLIAKHHMGIDVVARFLERLPRHGSTIVGREIFLSLMPKLNRNELLQIRRFYKRSTPAEKRAIIRGFMDNGTVHTKEKAAWLRAVSTTSGDIFTEQMISPVQNKKSKKTSKHPIENKKQNKQNLPLE